MADVESELHRRALFDVIERNTAELRSFKSTCQPCAIRRLDPIPSLVVAIEGDDQDSNSTVALFIVFKSTVSTPSDELIAVSYALGVVECMRASVLHPVCIPMMFVCCASRDARCCGVA
eukprot:scaffold905_cov223-Alexandrium_tamarense.AAC.9